MIRRLFSLALILFFILILTQGLIRLLPGDPLQTIVAETGSKLPILELRAQLHLDLPFSKAVIMHTQGILRGDWGTSLLTRRPVLPVLLDHFLQTFFLSSSALLVGTILSLIFGITALRVPAFSKWITAGGIATASLPAIILGPLILSSVRSLDSILPAMWAVAIPFAGVWSRLIRVRLQEALLLPYAQAARSRGLSELHVVLKYGLYPSSGALLAQLGTSVGHLFTGSLVTEYIFSRVGMGTLLVDSVLKRDYPLITAAVIWSAAFCLIGNLLGDLAQNLVDPRMRNSERASP